MNNSNIDTLQLTFAFGKYFQWVLCNEDGVKIKLKAHPTCVRFTFIMGRASLADRREGRRY